MEFSYQERLLSRVVEPASEPVTLAEAKLYLRVDGSDEDTLISEMIVAARVAAEQYLRRSLITQQWKLVFNTHAPMDVFLPMGPVQSVVSVVTVAEDSSTEAVSSTLYRLSASKREICFEQVISAHQVEITYGTGFGDPEDVPAPVKQGIFAHISEMYDGRSRATALPDIAVALYFPFREVAL